MKKIISIKAGFVGKVDDIDRSTLYTLYTCDGRFQLLHADVRNLEFLGKYATDPKYCLLFLDLFTSKVFVHPMMSRKLIATKMEFFDKEGGSKSKVKKQGIRQTLNLCQKNI